MTLEATNPLLRRLRRWVGGGLHHVLASHSTAVMCVGVRIGRQLLLSVRAVRLPTRASPSFRPLAPIPAILASS